MTAVESRLAATLAKHGNRFHTFPDGPMSDRRWTGRCICGHVLECRTSMEPEPEGWLAEAHERHVAAVIASADDLAVIELPKPEPDVDRPTFDAGCGAIVHAEPEGDVRLHSVAWIAGRYGGVFRSPRTAVQLAAAILAAARAVEAHDGE